MKVYKAKNCIIIERDTKHYLLQNENWDQFVNDDDLAEKVKQITSLRKPEGYIPDVIHTDLEAPIQSQELWASGVTYLKSRMGRQEEAKTTWGGAFYAQVYDAERPELFFKATSNRIAGPGSKVRIRKDSTWNVPEPELTLMISSSGKIIGYTIGNDMSSRSIEGENPLYLPQAKTYDGCAALGPCIYVSEKPFMKETVINLGIIRHHRKVFEGNVDLSQMKRTPENLVSYLYRECSFEYGSLLMTGTGIVPPNDFTLQSGDEIRITILPIGTLINTVE